MVARTLLSGALFAGVTFAQAAPNSSYSAQDITSVIGNVEATTRSSWCNAQRTTCGRLCGSESGSIENRCDGTTLNYTCTCRSNNSAPALQYYQDTIPTLVCNSLNGQCMETNAGNLAGQENCNVTYVCGTINSTALSQESSSDGGADSSASASDSSPSPTASGATETSETASASSSAAAAVALRVGEQYGIGILGAGLLAVMGLVL